MLYTWYKNSKEFGGRIWNYIYSIYFCPYRNLILYMYIYIFLPIYGLGFHKLLFATSYMQTHAAIFYFLRPQSQTLLSFHNCFVIIEANSVYWPNLKQSVCYKINCLTSEIVNLFVPFKLNVLTNNLHSQICFILKFASCAFIFLKNWPLKKKKQRYFLFYSHYFTARISLNKNTYFSLFRINPFNFYAKKRENCLPESASDIHVAEKVFKYFITPPPFCHYFPPPEKLNTASCYRWLVNLTFTKW